MWLEAGEARTADDLLRRGLLPGWPEAWGNVAIGTLGPGQNRLTKPMDDGEWHEVVLVCDAEAGKATMYVDGEPTVAGPLEQVPGRPPMIQVGRAPTGPGTGAQFRGQIDEVRLYDRALSSGEIRLLWQKRDVRFGKAGAPERKP
jgi:hypothetical protein